MSQGANQPEDDVQGPADAWSVFVRGLDLPTASLKAAREAVALQLDILSPLPADQTAVSVQALGPGEQGLTRFAVGLAPLTLFDTPGAPAADGPAFVELPGYLDGEVLTFRFDNPRALLAALQARTRTFQLVGLSALCMVLVLGALSIRLGGEIERAQMRADATHDLVRQVSRQKRLQGEAQSLWQTAAGERHALMTSCAFETIAGSGGPAVLTDLAVADGVAVAGLSQALTPEQVSILGARGVKAAPDGEGASGDGQRRVLIDQAVCR